jgi:hypothetical protein
VTTRQPGGSGRERNAPCASILSRSAFDWVDTDDKEELAVEAMMERLRGEGEGVRSSSIMRWMPIPWAQNGSTRIGGAAPSPPSVRRRVGTLIDRLFALHEVAVAP